MPLSLAVIGAVFFRGAPDDVRLDLLALMQDGAPPGGAELVRREGPTEGRQKESFLIVFRLLGERGNVVAHYDALLVARGFRRVASPSSPDFANQTAWRRDGFCASLVCTQRYEVQECLYSVDWERIRLACL
jgi:hypothetical protein